MDVLWLLIILFSVIALETLIIVLIVWKTPVLVFLKASAFKLPLLYIIGKDRMGKFKTFKSENGAAYVGRDGLYHLTENSHTLEEGSKIPLYFAFRDLAATLLPEYPAIIQELREQGIILNTISDVQMILKQIKTGVVKDLPVSVQAYKTYKFHDLENMFPNNIDPTFIDSTVQCEISKGLKMIKNTPMIITGFIVLLVAAGVAIFIIQKAFTDKTLSVPECQAMISSVRSVSSVAVQAINNSAII